MRKAFALAAALLFAGLFSLAQAQSPQVRQIILTKQQVGAGAVYTGLGDIVSLTEYGSLRCYNAAYAGNVADIYAPADASHTQITCSPGGILNETIQPLATTCAVSCTIKTLTGQVAGHDWVNATEATRPTLVLNSIGTLPAMVFNGAKGLVSTAIGTINQVFSITAIAKRTTVIGADCILCTQSANRDLFFNTSGNAAMSWGTIVNSAATENVLHCFQTIGNGASSTLTVDGNSATTGNAGAGALANDYVIGANTASISANRLVGIVFEVGVKNADFTSLIGAIYSNQHAYTGC